MYLLNQPGGSPKPAALTARPIAAPEHVSFAALTRQLWRLIAPFRGRLALILLVTLTAIPLSLLTPVPLKIAVDSILGSRPLPPALDAVTPSSMVQSQGAMLVFVFGMYVVIMLANQVQGLALWRLSSYTGERMILAFRSRLFEHLQRLCVSYHDEHGPADSAYRLQHDAASIKQIPIDVVIPFVRSTAMLAGIVTLMFMIDWELALIALGLAPLIFGLTNECGRRLRKKWSEVKRTETATMRCVHEVLSATRVVRAFGRERDEHRRFVDHAVDWVKGHNQLAKIGSGFDFALSMVVACGTAGALLLGIYHVQKGLLSLGDFLLAMAYMAQLVGPLDMATKKVAELQSCATGFRRAWSILSVPPAVSESAHPVPISRAEGAVSFKDVSFSYDGKRQVLHRTSFTVPAGTRVGIVGKTGGGKSTLLNLLTRFYDPTEGAVTLDGIDLRDYRVEDLRRQFAVVLQEPVLFSGTIADNIRYGRPGCTDAEVERAAKAAHAHDFIQALPDGYATEVGDRGGRLSGGERQRISLARAFLRDAPILILDEPTSSLDVQTEGAIMEAMEELMRGRTTFLIAHRVSTLKHCDLQLTLRHGYVTVEALPARSSRLAPVLTEPIPA